MSNTYETFRDTIKATIQTSAVKHSKDGGTITVNWSIDRLFTACGEACQFHNVKQLPDAFKKIVRFELDAFRKIVMSNDGFTLKKTKAGHVFTRDGIEFQRVDTSVKDSIPLQEQLDAARLISSRLELRRIKAGAENNAEAELRIRKQRNRVLKEVAFLEKEIANQAQLAIEVNKLNGTLDGVKVEASVSK